jgi:hypothetical protein
VNRGTRVAPMGQRGRLTNGKLATSSAWKSRGEKGRGDESWPQHQRHRSVVPQGFMHSRYLRTLARLCSRGSSADPAAEVMPKCGDTPATGNTDTILTFLSFFRSCNRTNEEREEPFQHHSSLATIVSTGEPLPCLCAPRKSARCTRRCPKTTCPFAACPVASLVAAMHLTSFPAAIFILGL